MTDCGCCASSSSHSAAACRLGAIRLVDNDCFGVRLLVDIEDEEPADTNPAEVDDIMNDQHDDGAEADQALARKNRKAAVVESDEEDEIEQREAGPGVDTEAQSDDDVAARDVNVAEAFGSDSDNV